MSKYNLDAAPKKLLTIGNPKIAKGKKQGYLTAILHLAPHKLSGRNVCSHASAGCAAACLNTAGRGGINLDSDGLNQIQVARIQRTRYFTRDRANFMVDLADEIAAHVRRAIRAGFTPAIRLNGTSDIPWENVKLGAFGNIFDMFPDVQFYDYTKMPIRLRRNALNILNYHLTFSLSENNDAHAIEAIRRGINVAVAMNVKRSGTLPATFALIADTDAYDGVCISAPVIDGDATDLRFLDARSSFVGLRAKGRGKADTSGFVRNVN